MKCNIDNRTIFCHDNLEILKNINSNCIDLIYLDPPFNKKKVFTAPTGSSAEGASFSDIFKEEDVKKEWLQTIKEDYDKLYTFLNSVKVIEGNKSYNFCYLSYMAIRLIEMYRILKDTGSLYLHCDPTMSHYLKILLDIIFGEKNFRNEIVWKRITGSKGNVKTRYPSAKDSIFFYSKKVDVIPYKQQYKPLSDEYIKNFYRYKDDDGRIYRKAGGSRPSHYKYYLDESKGVPLHDLWDNIQNSQGKERTGYPTQKPLALLERIIKASSNEGDIVLDPFCGCATTCIASERLGREWIGIDISIKAYELVKQRLEKEVEGWKEFFDKSHKAKDKDIQFHTAPPKRTDRNGYIKDQKYIYVISHPKNKGWYKVGIASNVKSRLNSYQTADPKRQYQLEFSMLKDNYRECEKHIHTKFKNMFEWVSDDLERIIKAIKEY